MKFMGFKPGKTSLTSMPSSFFSELLPLIDDLAELKVTLFALWAFQQKGGDYPYLRKSDFSNNKAFMQGLSIISPDDVSAILDDGLVRTVKRGTLLQIEVDGTIYYFANTERGRAAVEQIKIGNWQAIPDIDNPIEILPERPNIYALYEQNIGQLTTMVADELKDMENEFPTEWIEDAIRIAVQNNARKLRYIQAVLERWRVEGRGEHDKSGRRTEEDGKRFVSGEFADFIEH